MGIRQSKRKVLEVETEVRDVRERLNRMASLGAELNAHHDLDHLMDRILFDARSFCNAESGAVFLLHGDELRCDYVHNDEVERRIERGDPITFPRSSKPLGTETISGTVATTGRPIRVADAYAIEGTMDCAFDTTRDDALGYRTQAVMSLPLRTNNEKVLGVLQLANPKSGDGVSREFTESDQHIIEHFAGLATVALERAYLTRSMVMRMIAMAELRDPRETGPHVHRVAGYALEIYDGWNERRGVELAERHHERDQLRIAAMLHDVGKVGIPDAILKKPGKLDDAEFALMQQHTIIGARLFSGLRTAFDDVARDVVLHHHERWDGCGYPGPVDPDPIYPDSDEPIRQGLAGEDIPLFARMVGLADVYDALSSRRAYKGAWPEAKVLELLRQEREGHFDPELVDIFLERHDAIRRITRHHPEDGANLPTTAS
jgi:HD-GYP domain-containing protein (c-di-GMP phosphodiesterase class II)